MTIRHATHADLDAILVMARCFVATTRYAQLLTLDEPTLAATVRQLIDAPDGVLLVAEQAGGGLVGMIALLVYLHPWSGDRVASELVWWMDPTARGGGLRLLRAADAWARARDVVVMQMIAPTPEVGQLYERLGYTPVEMAYQRRI